MRPVSIHSSWFLFFASPNPGLPGNAGGGYNHRRNLPVLPEVSREGAPTGPEFEMKRQSGKSRDAHPGGRENVPASAAETRADRLARIQREIAAGTYETPEKLEAAVERMLGVLAE